MTLYSEHVALSTAVSWSRSPTSEPTYKQAWGLLLKGRTILYCFQNVENTRSFLHTGAQPGPPPTQGPHMAPTQNQSKYSPSLSRLLVFILLVFPLTTTKIYCADLMLSALNGYLLCGSDAEGLTHSIHLHTPSLLV